MRFCDPRLGTHLPARTRLALVAMTCAVGGMAGNPAPAPAFSLCGSKIASAKWAYNNAGPGWTLTIKPTSCGLKTARFAPRNAFNQAIARAGGWKPNAGSLYEQFECHAWFVAVRRPSQTWNLDTWRPEVSWASEVYHQCNPPARSAPVSEPSYGPGGSAPVGGPASDGGPTPADGSSLPVFPVMNTSETPPDGVWFRNSPYTGDTDRVTGLGVYANERVQLLCYGFGDAVGPYHDTLWYSVTNATRPSVNGRADSGWLDAHYVDDGKLAGAVDAGVPAC